MSQISRPQQGRYITYPDCGGYTAQQWARVFRRLVQDSTTQGVFGGYLSEMEVTNPIGVTITVASGAALVNGHYCLNEDTTDPANDSDVDFAPSTPGADRIDKVVLVQNNTGTPYTTNLEFPTDLTDYAGLSSIPAHSCRLAILTGVSGGAARDLVQNVPVDGDIWMIELARYTITNAPAISVGPTDYRDYAPKIDTNNIENDAVDDTKVGNRVPQFYRRQGDGVSWQDPGTTTYTPTAVRQQGGTIQWTGGAASSGSITVNYPVAFSNAPLVFASCLKAASAGNINTGISVNGVFPAFAFKIGWLDTTGALHTELDFMWFAVGPQ